MIAAHSWRFVALASCAPCFGCQWVTSAALSRNSAIMQRIGCLCILAIVASTAAFPRVIQTKTKDFQETLEHLRPRTSAEVQTAAVEKLLIRLLGKNASLFQISVDPNIKPLGKDTFRIKKLENLNKVEIVGTSGVAAAWGLHYYLKTYCNCHISWEGSQLKLPSVLPDVNETVTSNDRFRYYQNVCTVGYSSTWWKWDEWEKNLDWMALNGINLALAFHAQEAIWERVYLKFNLNKLEIGQHFGGPAFLPWARMGNMRGWGGPLTDAWHEHTIKLQHSILNRMHELGIVPVLPAFAGHVPRDFLRVFPEANVTKVQSWNGFDDQYCCPFILEPTSPLFQKVGEEFLKMYIDEFGTDNIYNCDSFNENTPHTGDLAYLRAVGNAIYSTLSSVDPKAIWLMQGWLFAHDYNFWHRDRVEAYVTSVPIGKMIILDLQSEKEPQYEKFDSYFGQPFIWCMLHNFGGTLGMFGSSSIVNKRVFDARSMNNSTMIGTGLTPEGINQNYVIYELMNEMAYRKEPVNFDDWFANYALRRYGISNEYTKEAWQELSRTIYDYKDSKNIRGHYVITKRPSFNIDLWYWYDVNKFYTIWEKFVRASNNTANSDLFKHDIVDISRQALQLTADFIYRNITTAYRQRNLPLFQSASAQLLELFDDLEEVLASSADFLLGRWLEASKAAATSGTQQERDNHEFNARNQITLWGPTGEIVDYANKQWSGVVSDYFRPRWQLFLDEVAKALSYKENPNMIRIRQQIFSKVELPFSYSKKIHPTDPIGDSKKIADNIFKKWHLLWI